MPDTDKTPRKRAATPRDAALELVLAEMEMVSRLMTPLGRTPDRGEKGAAEDSADGTDEDLFDNMPV